MSENADTQETREASDVGEASPKNQVKPAPAPEPDGGDVTEIQEAVRIVADGADLLATINIEMPAAKPADESKTAESPAQTKEKTKSETGE
jgi:hypothetical protein